MEHRARGKRREHDIALENLVHRACHVVPPVIREDDGRLDSILKSRIKAIIMILGTDKIVVVVIIVIVLVLLRVVTSLTCPDGRDVRRGHLILVDLWGRGVKSDALRVTVECLPGWQLSVLVGGVG